MADSYTTLLRLRLQQTGGNRNTWGTLLNAAALQLIEDAIAGKADITVASASVTLSTQSGGTDQARMAILNLTGAPGVPVTLIAPTQPKLYLVINGTGQTVTMKTALGTGVALPSGARQLVHCDGTDVFSSQASTLGTVGNADALGGFPAAAYARLDAANLFTKGQAVKFVALSDGANITVDCTQSNNFYVQIAGNHAIAFNNQADGQTLELWVQQDGVGGRSLTWPSNVQFETGSDGTLSGGSNVIDRFELTYNSSLNLFLARRELGGGASSVSATITASCTNLDAFALAGSPAGAITYNLTVAQGVVIQSVSPTTPALDFSGFASGSTINLVNLGYILGCGGDGGDGAGLTCSNVDSTDIAVTNVGAKHGGAGGAAIKGPGSGRNFNIVNASGFIWGGGGGGGGGGVCGTAVGGGGESVGNGGGGGGGAGGGRAGVGGRAGSVFYTTATASNYGGTGGAGSIGPKGTNGAAGTAGTTTTNGAGNAQAGVGGAGGDWGTAGAAGTGPTALTHKSASGSAGAAGLAVDQNGGTANFSSGASAPHVKGAVT